ncbi:citrate lyase subunit beta [Clostridium magnum DSM 2767]|uniref:Citrate lyase subunit beta n=2 Tax=Clostridium magnum TaxID=33954 RepID=A0A161W1G2_9CLOT|nr:citrate lyase subunit beta [Clostridium magnum DSM 2767]SHI23315.1 citrate lyase subunit beta / citryl-CoA lyase [Clostridium magnum DSM 2767]
MEQIKLRRTMMYVTASNPAIVKDAHIYGSDSIMFDLEDSVSVNQKDAARFLIYNALKTVNYRGKELVVRVNGLDTPFGIEDFKAIVKAKPDIIRLPKTETPEDVREADKLVTAIEKEAGMETGTVKLMAAVESPMGIINCFDIAKSSPRLVAMAIGAEDFVTTMKTVRSLDGEELIVARGQLLIACRAAGIHALDTVFSDINDEEGFENEVRKIHKLGFDGKSVIHPRQIPIVHKVFSPTEKQIQYALRTFKAIEEAERNNSGVIALDGKMIDKPMVERARRVISLAKASGIYRGGDLDD